MTPKFAFSSHCFSFSLLPPPPPRRRPRYAYFHERAGYFQELFISMTFGAAMDNTDIAIIISLLVRQRDKYYYFSSRVSGLRRENAISRRHVSCR